MQNLRWREKGSICFMYLGIWVTCLGKDFLVTQSRTRKEVNSLWQEAFKKECPAVSWRVQDKAFSSVFYDCSQLPSSLAAIHVLGWRWNTLCLLLLPQAERAE